MNMRQWLWPLPGVARKLSETDGAFGWKRRYEIHTGSDLYCLEGQEVTAVDDGHVLLVTDFTGEAAGSPWWNQTKAVLVRHYGGYVVVYGEIEPAADLKVGTPIKRGQPLGHVVRVRKQDRGKPMTMLHFELWRDVESALNNFCADDAMEVACDWKLDGKRPDGLLDPTRSLLDAEGGEP